MSTLTRRLALHRVNFPTAPSRHLLAYLHSGDVLRQALPWVLRTGIMVWFVLNVLAWLSVWPSIYREFERWGLVKAFFAQLILLATAFLVTRITMLRGEQLRSLPPDDFVSLRAVAVLSRWMGDIALLYCIGEGLGYLLQPVGPLMTGVLNGALPSVGEQVRTGSANVLLVSSPLTMFFVDLSAIFFLAAYALATAIDVYLAIEFNTRATRAGRGASS